MGGVGGAYFVNSIGECCRRGLVDDTDDVEARDGAGVFGCFSLLVVEVGRHSDDGMLDPIYGEYTGALPNSSISGLTSGQGRIRPRPSSSRAPWH